ncbi:MAG: hypothetical protein U9O86_01110 [Campylobacterota bacterium]|nr:hypothetical protein [Campylobacterota bacterium]
MKNILTKLVTSFTITTMACSTLWAQQFGLGVGVTGNNASVIRGTIDLNENMRLEPYVSFAYVNPKNTPSSTTVSVGTAFHLMQSINDKLSMYYGGYTGIGYADFGTTTTILNFGPVGGVEYALDKQFTLGAEINVNIGVVDTTSVGTNSTAILRYYF